MKYLIIPDVHGREFWKSPVNEALKDENTHIVFLGDYLDPYEFENIKSDVAISNFELIINLAKTNPNRITLLIGNHDLQYLNKTLNYCGCRKIEHRKFDINIMFNENMNLFKVAYECQIGEKKYLMTHAGILPKWYEYVCNNIEFDDITKITDNLNFLLESSYWFDFLYNCISTHRGGFMSFGSCVWADVYEHMFNKDITDTEYKKILDTYYQIFGHTLSYPTIYDYAKYNDFAMLDCGKAFILNEDNELLLY